MKTFPPTALEVPYCPPHLIKIEMVNVSKNGKPVIHQIGRCDKCKFTKDYGQYGDSGKILTARGREACSKGGKKRQEVRG